MVSTTSPVAFGILHIASMFCLANKHGGCSLVTLHFTVDISIAGEHKISIDSTVEKLSPLVHAAVHMGMLRSGGCHVRDKPHMHISGISVMAQYPL